MKTTIATNNWSRSVLSGLMAGVLAAIANFFFVVIYRLGTGVNAYEYIISPVFIGFGFPILLTLAGLIYFVMNRYLPKGVMWYSILFVLLTLLAVLIVFLSQGTGSIFSGSKGLLFGMIIITGLMISFLIPYLARHPKIFMTKEGVRESK